MFGCASMAQVKLTRGAKGEYLSVNMAFSLGVMSAMYIARGVSGAHLNPAVSLSCCVLGRLPWSKLLPYCMSQVLGAYIAAVVVFLVYYDAIMDYSDPTSMVGTGMIMMCFLSLDDRWNKPALADLVPPLTAVVLMGISQSMSSNCGGGINPARDLGPRLLTLTAGWAKEVFMCYNYWFWVPIVAPMVGAVLGSGLYLVFVQWHLPDSEINETNDLQFKTMDTKTVEKLEIIKNCRVELDPNKVAIGCPKSH
ncbi:LOW QUALITY PROTEIN: aquaporin-3 [Salmo salar]|uniref:LOW QUALITY PROTEIN: aquaporin-3 n=1 Tax=Salmo salar TaxID=8030 RepID=A0ABM3E431_SALSA|nr:LOW QUALITY PROTEIN: aquaporin-3 [Salmo salar]